MYQLLCKPWKPAIEEEKIIKLVLKNINPPLVSQLRSSRVTSVDGLVCLGQQLEKDRENQLQCEQRRNVLKKTSKPAASESAVLPPNRENPVRPNLPCQNRSPQVYCWHCKGSHAPSTCPQRGTNKASSPRPSHQDAAITYHIQESHPTLGSLTHTSYPGATTTANSLPTPLESSLLCQLMVPLNTGPWKGAAILDSGSSYTLINENVWTGVKGHHDELKPWTRDPCTWQMKREDNL